jgi:AmmeMemoRadiSam system protein A
MSSNQVELAKKTIESFITKGVVIPVPSDVPAEMKEKAGVFVSIHKGENLRGCIGTFLPTTKSVAEEIIRNAIEAATRDPRFPPIKPEELKDLDISVDVLTKPVPVKDINELNPKKWGIIVTSGGRRGLLLPDLEGVDTAAQQIEICRHKAWIEHDAPITIEKFEVRRFH